MTDKCTGAPFEIDGVTYHPLIVEDVSALIAKFKEHEIQEYTRTIKGREWLTPREKNEQLDNFIHEMNIKSDIACMAPDSIFAKIVSTYAGIREVVILSSRGAMVPGFDNMEEVGAAFARILEVSGLSDTKKNNAKAKR